MIDIAPYPPTHYIDIDQSLRQGRFISNFFKENIHFFKERKKLYNMCVRRFGSNIISRLEDADIIFFQGEGSIGQARSYKRTQLYGLPLLASLMGNKRLISINQTVSYKTMLEKDMLSSFFKRFELNYVREAASLSKTKEGFASDFSLIPDLALFYNPVTQISNMVSSGKYFCVTGSAELHAYDIKSYAKVIRHISHRWGLIPVFVYSRRNDAKLLSEYLTMGDVEYIKITPKTHPDVDSIIEILKNAEMVIGGRYHTAITALSQSTPVILTESNSHKSQGLALLYNDLIEYIPLCSMERIILLAERLIHDRVKISYKLRKRLGELNTISERAQDNLRSTLGLEDKALEYQGSSTTPDLKMSNNSHLKLFSFINRQANVDLYDRRSLVS